MKRFIKDRADAVISVCQERLVVFQNGSFPRSDTKSGHSPLGPGRDIRGSDREDARVRPFKDSLCGRNSLPHNAVNL
jgi:hypothetical protein